MVIVPLEEHLDLVPVLAGWFRDEWPEWADSLKDGEIEEMFRRSAKPDGVPRVLVALDDVEPVGTAALREESISTHLHLTPWLTGVYVVPERRGRVIGQTLVRGILAYAREQRMIRAVYTSVRKGVPGLQREGWEVVDRAKERGEDLIVLRMSLVSNENASVFP